MKHWIISRLWAVEHWCARMRDRIDPPPEVDWPTVVVDTATYNKAFVASLKELNAFAAHSDAAATQRPEWYWRVIP